MTDHSIRPPLFEVNIPLRWGDQDAMGHVNNTVFYRLQEEARVMWFAQEYAPVTALQQGPIQAHGSCDFLKPLLYPCTATVRLYCSRVGNSSADFMIEIYAGTQRVSRGLNVLVWFDYPSGKAVAWPLQLREKMLANVEELPTG